MAIFSFGTDKAKTFLPGFGLVDSCKHGMSHLTYRERKEAEKKIVEDKTRSERLKILEVRIWQLCNNSIPSKVLISSHMQVEEFDGID